MCSSVLWVNYRVWTHSKCIGLIRTEFAELANKIKAQGILCQGDFYNLEVNVVTQDELDSQNDEDDSINMHKLKRLLDDQSSKLTTSFQSKFNGFKSVMERNIIS